MHMSEVLSENMEINNNIADAFCLTVTFTKDNKYVLSVHDLSWKDQGFYQSEKKINNGMPDQTTIKVEITGNIKTI